MNNNKTPKKTTKLEEGEEKYKFLVDKMHEIAIILNKTGTILFANRSALETMGYKEDEVMGKSITGFLAEGSVKKAFWALAQEFLGKHHGEFEVDVKNKKGEIRTLRIAGSSNPVHKDGKMVGLLICADDITERKKAEEALRASDVLLQAAIGILPVGLWVMDAEGKIVTSSVAAQRIWAGVHCVGIDQLGEYKGWRTDTGKLVEAHEWAGARALKKGETSIEEEVEIECFDGTHKIILDSAVPLRKSDGSIYGAVTINQDITERKQAEEKFKTIFEGTGEGILIADPESKKFLLGNSAISEMLGYSKEEISSLGVMDIHPEKDIPYVVDQFEKQLKGDFSLSKDLPVKRKDGSVFYADVNATTVNIGGKTCLVGFFHDTTERKQAEEELKKKFNELEKMNKSMVDRELRMVELKKELSLEKSKNLKKSEGN